MTSRTQDELGWSVPKMVKAIFYGEVTSTRRHKNRDTTIRIKSSQIDKDMLEKLKRACTPICFEISYFSLPKRERHGN